MYGVKIQQHQKRGSHRHKFLVQTNARAIHLHASQSTAYVSDVIGVMTVFSLEVHGVLQTSIRGDGTLHHVLHVG